MLVGLCCASGLDGQRANEILESDEYAGEVRAQEQFYADHGIHSVPSIILNDESLIQGGQAPAVFEQALRKAAGE